MRRWYHLALTCLITAVGCSGPSLAKTAKPEVSSANSNPIVAQTCEHAEAASFRFLVGRWQGDDGSLYDVKPVLGGCAFEEQRAFSNGKRLVAAIQLRAYDAGTQRWMMTYISDDLVYQTWEGKKEDQVWWFYRQWLDNEGAAVISRVAWHATATGFEIRIEQSRDGGKKWKPHYTGSYQSR